MTDSDKPAVPKKAAGTIRGTVLLCDHTYQSRDNKWVIAGTYTHWWTVSKTIVFTGGIGVYLRFQVDHPGMYNGKVALHDRTLPGNAPALLEVDFEARVQDPDQPVETGLRLPQFSIKSPMAPSKIPKGKPLRMRLMLCLEVNDNPVASSPLNIIFRNPKDVPKNANSAVPTDEG